MSPAWETTMLFLNWSAKFDQVSKWVICRFREATEAGWLQWLGKVEKGWFRKTGLEKLEKDSLFSGVWLEKLDFYFWLKSHWVFHLGIIQTLRNTWAGGGRVANFVTNHYGNLGEGRRVSVMSWRNADKIFYMANFTRNLPVGNYSLYYLTSKTLAFRWKLF